MTPAVSTVIHHQRRPLPGSVSVERLFDSVREGMSSRWKAAVAVSPEFSTGLAPRLRNLAWARRQTADVHHITGDVHYLAYRLPAARLVVTMLDVSALIRLSGWRREVFRQVWYRLPARRAAAVTTISASARDELHEWLGNDARDVEVIPCTIRDEFQPDPRPFPDIGPVVLQVGTAYNKNVERVAEALAGTGFTLHVVGGLTEAQRAILTAAGVPHRDLGRVSDDALVHAYRRADLVVFASLYEGFGIPILEAQATGRPVVTSNRHSMPEAAGGAALLVDPENVRDIRDALLRIAGDETVRDGLVAQGYRNVERYRPRAIAARYESVYDRVLASAGPLR